MRSIISAALSLMAFNASADLYDWEKAAYKNENPDTLAYFVNVGKQCPFNWEELENIVRGVFVRSRIKPLGGDAFNNGSLYLNLDIYCLSVEGSNDLFVDGPVRFGRIMLTTPVLYDRNYGRIGVGFGGGDAAKDYVLRLLKEGIEDAITAYLEANFDLGE